MSQENEAPVDRCEDCDGSGMVSLPQGDYPTWDSPVSAKECPSCHGDGWTTDQRLREIRTLLFEAVGEVHGIALEELEDPSACVGRSVLDVWVQSVTEAYEFTNAIIKARGIRRAVKEGRR